MPDFRVVLISAPAGYGKSTLAAQWARLSRYSVGWLSIGEEDNDPDRLLRYLMTAWEAVQPTVRDTPLGLLLRSMAPDRATVLTSMVNLATCLTEHLIFVLDDFHLINEPEALATLSFLIDHLPSTLHFVLVGRGEPRLPLARYRARGELLEIRTSELRFVTSETADFLNVAMGLSLSHDEIDALQRELEGWPAGLQLAALTIGRNRSAAGSFAVSGRHRYIADYLAEEVLARLPDECRSFLLRTAILDRVSASLCDAVTGRNDSREMLARLERDNLFLIPLDDQRDWFRFHTVFADFLRSELQRHYPADVALLHARAAQWFLARDVPEPAFQHAVSSGDVDLLINVTERYFSVKLLGGEVRVAQRWIELLPPAWIDAHPVFGVYKAGLKIVTGDMDSALLLIGQLEQRLSNEHRDEAQALLPRLSALRCFVACVRNDLDQAEIYADHALRELPERDLTFRPGVYGALGDTYRRNGRWQDARVWYLKLLDFVHSPLGRIESVHLFGALADLDLRRGRLRDAARYWARALKAIEAPANQGSFDLPITGWVYIRMAELLYEWNDLTAAWDHLSKGLERAELGGDPQAIVAGYLIAGRAQLALGDAEAASDYLERARPLLQSGSVVEWISQFERLQLDLWLRQGQLRAALAWSETALREDQGVLADIDSTRLSVARAWIAAGDATALSRALAMFGMLYESAGAEGRLGVQIEALALLSLATWAQGARADALTTLERALRQAEPEGYVRLFADLGIPMSHLLHEARSRDVMAAYVDRILTACGDDHSPYLSRTAQLPEPLTSREREVLALIAAGLTNQEIADRLFISPETVKKHASNVYAKLGTRSRTEAVARARDLHLLS